MNEKVLKTLEYNKILNQLSEYACSPEAKKRCLALRPITDKAQIEQLQLQTKDALSRLFRCGNLSFSGVHSVNDSLKRLEIGASLSAAELLSICSLLRGCQACKSIFPLRKRGSSRRFTDRIFHRNRTADTAL